MFSGKNCLNWYSCVFVLSTDLQTTSTKLSFEHLCLALASDMEKSNLYLTGHNDKGEGVGWVVRGEEGRGLFLKN